MRVTLPAGWTQSDEHRMGPGLLRDHDSPAGKAAQIRYFRTLYQYVPADAARFRGILEGPLHSLKLSEIKTLSAWVDNNWDDTDRFSVKSARTEVLNGRRVAFIEGAFVDGEQAYVVIFIDHAGTSPREISFSGQAPRFAAYWNEVKRMLDSIRWDE